VAQHLLSDVAERFERIRDDYDPDSEVDLGGFTASLTTYAASVAALAMVLRATGRPLPEHYRAADVVLGGVAVHKFSRLLAKGSVTSPLRAPFTEFDEPAGAAEHNEAPRGGSGPRHTIGELLSCPFCLGVWLGTAYVGGLAVAPRPTRAWAAVFGVVGLSDFLHHLYGRVRTG
jgi:hypothetical protein